MEFKQRHLVRSVDSVKQPAVAIQAGINEDLEKRRRLLDIHGEEQRRWVANKTAQLYSFTPVSLHHVQWPVHAELPRTAPSLIVKPALLQHLNKGFAQAIHNASELTHTISQRTAAAAGNLSHKTADIASTVSLKTQDLASTVSQTTTEVANTVRQKTADVVHRAEIKTVYAADKVASTVNTVVIPRAQEFAHDAAAIATSVVPMAIEIAREAQELALDAKLKIEHVAEDMLESTTKVYVKALEEGERRRRKVAWEEQYAILNAFAVSNLIRGLGWEFYRQSDCVFLHNLRALEEHERSWRMRPDNVARDEVNAKRVSLLIDAKFSPARISLPPADVDVAPKVEVVEPPARSAQWLAPSAPRSVQFLHPSWTNNLKLSLGGSTDGLVQSMSIPPTPPSSPCNSSLGYSDCIVLNECAVEEPIPEEDEETIPEAPPTTPLPPSSFLPGETTEQPLSWAQAPPPSLGFEVYPDVPAIIIEETDTASTTSNASKHVAYIPRRFNSQGVPI